MIETFIQLKPKDQWRAGVTSETLRQELDSLVKFPGLTNAWVMPIKTRIDMLSTGIKTPVGIKIAGPDLSEIEKIGKQLETILPRVQGTASVYSERVAGGRYIKVDIDRNRASRFGLSIEDIQSVVRTAVGGMNLTETVEGLERYPVNIRYPQSYRDSEEKLKNLPIVTPARQTISLADVAHVYIADGPPGIKSENARLNGWTLVDIDGRDLGSYVQEAQQLVAEQLELPAGYSIAWSGQYEYMLRAEARMKIVVPLTLAVIVLLLYLNFRNGVEVLIILGTLPFALIGGIGFMYWMEFNMSIAVAVGFIALAGLAIEIGVLMLVYLNHAYADMLDSAEKNQQALQETELRQAVLDGAALRVRPIMMTVLTVIIGLFPVMMGGGTGSEVMQRIAGPMVGGMASTLVLTLLVLPVIYYLWKRRALKKLA
jgi:Cu(I)/Ag(I) efflux system membrane protein CusA/SilA